MRGIKRIFGNFLIHLIVLLMAINLGFNSFKEFLRTFVPGSNELQEKNEPPFLWPIVLYLILNSFQFAKKDLKGLFLITRNYLLIFFSYVGLLNILYISESINFLISLNLVFLWIILLLKFFGKLGNFFYWGEVGIYWEDSKIREWIPPALNRLMKKYLPKAQVYSREKPSAPFIVTSIFLLAICAILFVLKAETAAEEFANIAYFSLIIGVGIELFQLIKSRGKNSEINDS